MSEDLNMSIKDITFNPSQKIILTTLQENDPKICLKQIQNVVIPGNDKHSPKILPILNKY